MKKEIKIPDPVVFSNGVERNNFTDFLIKLGVFILFIALASLPFFSIYIFFLFLK